jgi:hypothetical protein
MSADRAATILARFAAAHQYLLSTLRDLDPERAARHPTAERWSAAQIGAHVAMANEWTAGVLAGTNPLAQAVPEGFVERFGGRPGAGVPWNVKAFPLHPPDAISCDQTIERLRVSAHHLSRAIASLTPERGAGYCVTIGVGTLSLFELAEYTAAHVLRHAAELEDGAGPAAT